MPQHYPIAGKRSSEIAASIERALSAGTLRPGDRLPAVRDLARTLGVSLGTAAAAYRTLHARGIVVGEGRRGTHVRAAPPVAAPTPPVASLASANLRDYSDGNPDPELLPALGPALRAVPIEPRLYGSEPIDGELLARMRADFAADGIAAEAAVVTSGALDGIERALVAMTRAGDRVAVEDPLYPAHRSLLGALALVADPVAVDARGLEPAALRRALERGAQAVLLTPRAQNPTGAALDRERTMALRRVLRAHPHVALIEDDHAWLVAGTPAFTLTPERERWFVVRSFSKTFGPDVRVAVGTGDPLTVARIAGRQRLGPGWVSHLNQGLVLALWTQAERGGRIAAARATYAARRDLLRAALAGVGIHAAAASGFNLWIPVADETAAILALRAAGIAAAAGSAFRVEAGPAVRITVSLLDAAAAARIAQALSRTATTGARLG